MEKEMKFDRDILLRNILESQQRQIDSLENRINRLSLIIATLIVFISVCFVFSWAVPAIVKVAAVAW